jgi:hypothetical protein
MVQKIIAGIIVIGAFIVVANTILFIIKDKEK